MASKPIVLKYLQIADTLFRDIHDVLAKSKFGVFNEPLLIDLFFSYKCLVGVLRFLFNSSPEQFSSDSFRRFDNHSRNLIDVWDLVVQYRNESRSVSIDNLFNDVFSS